MRSATRTWHASWASMAWVIRSSRLDPADGEVENAEERLVAVAELVQVPGLELDLAARPKSAAGVGDVASQPAGLSPVDDPLRPHPHG